jgi:hypothetical protein
MKLRPLFPVEGKPSATMPNLRGAPVNARSLFLFLLLIPILVPCAFAQLYAGSVAGVVKDSSGAVIAGAPVARP